MEGSGGECCTLRSGIMYIHCFLVGVICTIGSGNESSVGRRFKSGIESDVLRIVTSLRIAFLMVFPYCSSGVTWDGGFVNMAMMTLLACYKLSSIDTSEKVNTIGK